jgi:hypothetical protein
MRKLILTCLMALFACTVNAQINVDSLENVLNTQELTNKEKIELFGLYVDIQLQKT